MGDAAMNVVPRASQWGDLIRPDRVHGSLYSDPAIFEAELQNIWYRTWVYVGHESEVPDANDYVVKSIGPQSVIMTRDEQGGVNLLLNRCSHRGNQVCSYDKAVRAPSHARSIHGRLPMTAVWSVTPSPTAMKARTSQHFHSVV
jgi:Rieske 2Fe-2S protein